ncbi:single-stranded-DNA-specific exonuclease RecJ [Candidatus Deianiraea vastatrix]|uniref:Single-stranded-DNA-specific exonuclease RecJ n=1 Tax=Candidatus Deianiraea vastatrix TaxID=2163644 RepID=A0A5B8XGB1_9RICK|nr:single-stranded-DNA-specific exonuclease RecJ [Candidatus Deianiraea vastatrix]QED23919.1 Single-stranded-DNA-specific exonuclease RecJ [Candidatus Deianiraea vastatrix]
MKKTALGRNLNILESNLNKSSQIASLLSISPILGDILAKTDGVDVSNAEDFLNPKLKNLMPNPSKLMGMDLGVTHLCKAIIDKKTIGILGDYDVDGVSSSSMLKIFLILIGILPKIIIPNRFKDGYGPSIPLMHKMHMEKVDTIVTLDCGTVAFEPLEYAKALGMNVVVVDHHISQIDRPEAIAIINPNQLGDDSKMGYLCAAGVTFLLCVALNAKLREMGFYEGKKEPNLLNLVPFAMLGSVCDMMKMIGLNRAFYHTGIAVLQKNLQNYDSLLQEEKIAFCGLRQLILAGGKQEISSSYDIGFIIGPMINAGGRIDSAMIGVDLLTNTDETDAARLAAELKTLNQERREIQEEIIESAKKMADLELASGKNVLFLKSDKWHEGVIGIVASKIKDLYQKPTIIGSISKNSGVMIIKASCRSIDGVDIGKSVICALENGLILKGGGHAGAAGFSAKLDDFERLFDFFEQHLHQDVVSAKDGAKIDIHCQISLEQIDDKIRDISRLEPFGIGNPKPLFLIKNAVIGDYSVLKELHFRLNLRTRHKNDDKYLWKSAILFNANATLLGDFVKKHQGKEVDIIANIEYGSYGLSIVVVDFAN